MADISNLTNLAAAEPLDWDKYVDTKEAQVPPRKGRYQLQAPPSFAFSATGAGYLSAQIDPTVVGPTDAGYAIKYSRVSAKPFLRSGVKVSQMGDYLRSVGITTRPTSPTELANAVEQTAGRIYQGDLDWEAYCKGCKFTLKGMENFPADGKGGHQPWTVCPNCKQTVAKDDGTIEEKAVTLRANARVERFVSSAA